MFNFCSIFNGQLTLRLCFVRFWIYAKHSFRAILRALIFKRGDILRNEATDTDQTGCTFLAVAVAVTGRLYSLNECLAFLNGPCALCLL